MKITKSKMTDMLSIFKKGFILSDSFILVNDCMLPIGNVKNGSHVIRHGLVNNFDEIVYVPDKFMQENMKQLEDKKGIKDLQLIWDFNMIGFLADDEPFILMHSDVNDKYPVKINFDEKISHYDNWYKVCVDDLIKIRDSKVAQLPITDGVVRVSKNTVPFIGAARKNTEPNFSIFYTWRDDNVLIMHVKYNKFEALHGYSFIPINIIE